MSVATMYKKVMALLSEDDTGELERLIGEIIEVEEQLERERGSTNKWHTSWEWYEVHGDPRTLNKLVTLGILDITMKTNKSTHYHTRDRGTLKKALNDYDRAFKVVEEEVRIPDDLMEIIVGHDDKKEIIARAIRSERPVHLLLWGSIASAKSLILEELARLPRSRFILGSSMSRAGLYDILFIEQPRYLIIDELDKVDDAQNLTALLSLMESGRVIETKYRKRREIKLRTWVFSSANRIAKIPPELLSRFQLLRFRNYTDEEFIEVSEIVLTKREGITPALAGQIALQVLRHLKSRDVRDCVKVARLLDQENPHLDLPKVIELLKKQR